jgi:hypothetical protein
VRQEARDRAAPGAINQPEPGEGDGCPRRSGAARPAALTKSADENESQKKRSDSEVHAGVMRARWRRTETIEQQYRFGPSHRNLGAVTRTHLARVGVPGNQIRGVGSYGLIVELLREVLPIHQE